VVPVLRLASTELTERALDCLGEAGFGSVEITMTTPQAITLLGRFKERFFIGAGTVLDLDTARRCLDAGAQFLVSPCLVPGMAKLAHDARRLALIGGFTPGEVLAAHREGADIVKLFPASTGGVTLESLNEYFAAGAALVAVGNNIIDQKALAAGERAAVVAHARRFLR